MRMKDAVRERGLAVENEFFDKETRHLLEHLRRAHDHEEDRAALLNACGVHDEMLLERLLENEVRAENVAAPSLGPLVLGPWADRDMAWS